MTAALRPHGLYAVTLPPGGFGPAGTAFGRCFSLVRRLSGDYDRIEKAWYVAVLDARQAAILAELTDLGAAVRLQQAVP